VTHQLQVERGTGKVRRPETDVLPLCHATNGRGEINRACRLALNAGVLSLKVPCYVQWTRSQLAQLSVHDAQAASVRLPRATGVKYPQCVDRAAEVAEVAVNAAAEAWTPIAGRLHDDDVMASVATRCERLVLAELFAVTRQREPRRTCQSIIRRVY